MTPDEAFQTVNVILRKTSFVDYPGKISAVLFFPGCNLRCPWCHNGDLVAPEKASLPPNDLIPLEDALAHFEKRCVVLGGAVLSGGEPTLCRCLPNLIRRIKEIGLPVKLDTNGMHPAMLETLFQSHSTSPDYIALDLKLSPDRYTELLPHPHKPSGDAADPVALLRRSAELIRISGVEHEYRTLALPGVTTADIDALAPLTDNAPWFVRAFRPGGCLDPAWDAFSPSTDRDIAALTDRILFHRASDNTRTAVKTG